MAAAREVAAFLVSELFEDEVPLEEWDDELENLAACYLQSERAAASRISGYVEGTVRNYSDATFKRHFRMSRDTFQWLVESLQKGGRATVPLENQLLLTLRASGKPSFLQVEILFLNSVFIYDVQIRKKKYLINSKILIIILYTILRKCMFVPQCDKHLFGNCSFADCK